MQLFRVLWQNEPKCLRVKTWPRRAPAQAPAIVRLLVLTDSPLLVIFEPDVRGAFFSVATLPPMRPFLPSRSLAFTAGIMEAVGLLSDERLSVQISIDHLF
jgi:hypothetical protein